MSESYNALRGEMVELVGTATSSDVMRRCRAEGMSRSECEAFVRSEFVRLFGSEEAMAKGILGLPETMATGVSELVSAISRAINDAYGDQALDADQIVKVLSSCPTDAKTRAKVEELGPLIWPRSGDLEALPVKSFAAVASS